MKDAGHIGRVGALAVALGVGLAVATTPGVAVALPSEGDSASSAGDSGSANTPSSTTSSVSDATSPDGGAAGADGSDGVHSPAALPESATGSTDLPAQAGTGAPVVVISGSGGARPATDDETISLAGDSDSSPAGDGVEFAAKPAAGSGQDDVPTLDGDVASHRAPTEPSGGGGAALPHADDADGPSAAVDDLFTRSSEQAGSLDPREIAAKPSNYGWAVTVSADALPQAAVDEVVPPAAPTAWGVAGEVVSAVTSVASQFVTAVVTQLLATGPSPTQSPLLWAMMGFARREFGFFDTPSAAATGSEDTVPLAPLAPLAPVDPTSQHVLVIGVDGMNLRNVLADDYNQNLFDLMSEGTTAASSIVGHATISNPSWTGVLTGVWSDRTGVINNVFTPWTYDTWPTVFNQLETIDRDIKTMAIVDGSINAPIAGAGSIPADTVVHFDLIDDNWSLTDDAVGNATVDALSLTSTNVPNFLFTSFAGVDNNGHDFGGDSEEYKLAIENINDNLGLIMAAVEAREACDPGPCESWTVMMVTDHGHMGPYTLGIGHGFQSPRETSIMVIARDKDGTVFTPGAINNTYRNVDITPTVVQLFGGTPEPYSDGMPLMDRAANGYQPVDQGQDALKQALNDALDQYGYPDITTEVGLDARTLFATVPYLIDDFNTTIIEGLQGFADTPVVGALATVLEVPINIVLGGFIYEATNIPAQIVARLTGVTGNDIIPPDIISRLTGGLLTFQLPILLTSTAPLSTAAPVCDDNSPPGAPCTAA